MSQLNNWGWISRRGKVYVGPVQTKLNIDLNGSSSHKLHIYVPIQNPTLFTIIQQNLETNNIKLIIIKHLIKHYQACKEAKIYQPGQGKIQANRNRPQNSRDGEAYRFGH